MTAMTMDLGARKFGLVWFCSVFEPARADRRPECTMSTVAYTVFSLWRCRMVVFVAVLWLYSFCLRSSAIQYNLEINPLSTINSVMSFHKVDSTEVRRFHRCLLTARQARITQSGCHLGLPLGSVCRPGRLPSHF